MRSVFTSADLVHMIQSHYGAGTPDLPSFSGRVASWIGVKSNSPIPSTSSPGCLRGSSSNQERYDSETYQVITPSKPFLISLKSYKTKTLFLAQNQYWPISSPPVLAWSLAARNNHQNTSRKIRGISSETRTVLRADLRYGGSESVLEDVKTVTNSDRSQG